MNKQELRKQCRELFQGETWNDCQNLLEIYINFIFEAIMNHQEEVAESHRINDAKIILQMMLTKALNLKQSLYGISYDSKSGSSLNNIIDPTIIASLVRNIYETVAMFNLIYTKPQTEDEKNIMYLLWVSAGLKYRQRFDDSAKSIENQKKLNSEKEEIEKIEKSIQITNLYKSLNTKEQTKINNKLKEKDYQMYFDGLSVKFVSWQETLSVMGIKDSLLPNIYTYLSFYSHPSNVSVFQFSGMFDKGNEAYPEIAKFNVKVAFFMFSIFIADYIKIFPNVLKTFEKMSLVEQIAINFHNTMARSYDYSINDCATELEE
jgi:hypothetical protein